jgi:hypothetical protein
VPQAEGAKPLRSQAMFEALSIHRDLAIMAGQSAAGGRH